MKFSVLLPTRNRLDYLRYAVQTVLRQDYTDWELIISDNCSEEDIAGYVQSLNDARIKYYRTESFVPVTENWNNALYKSSGDYVIMLGDDDGLMQDYFTTMHRLISEYSEPDVIYTKAYIFAYPGVMPGHPRGYLHEVGCAEFFGGANNPFWLDKAQALHTVQQTLDFRMGFDFNMQFSLVSRKFIDSLQEKGKFFQSPFPDYYASNVAFLKADRILIYPYPVVTVGITPKSYGFFHFNNRESEGMEFLKSRSFEASYQRMQRVMLPGTNMNTGWLLSMETLKANYGAEHDLQVNYRRYRMLQIIYVYQGYYLLKTLSKENVDTLKREMSWKEKIVTKGSLFILFLIKTFMPMKPRRKLVDQLLLKIGQYPRIHHSLIEGRYQNLLEVFEQVSPAAKHEGNV